MNSIDSHNPGLAMKKSFALALTLASLLPLCARADAPAAPADAAAGGLRFSIAVSKFENHANYSGSQFQLSDTWGSMLTDSLQQSGHFIVLGEAGHARCGHEGAGLCQERARRRGRQGAGHGQHDAGPAPHQGRDHQFPDDLRPAAAASGLAASRSAPAASTAEINAVLYVVDSTTGQVVASHKVLGKVKSSGLSVGFTDATGAATWAASRRRMSARRWSRPSTTASPSSSPRSRTSTGAAT
jgi:hypothetical protein